MSAYPTAHFYCDFMPGHPVSRLFDFSAMADGDHEDDELLKTFIDSYADYQIALSKIRFESIGQLISSPDNEPIIVPFEHLTIRSPASEMRHAVPLASSTLCGSKAYCRPGGIKRKNGEMRE